MTTNICLKPLRLLLGQAYTVLGRKCIFMRSTKKGFNFYIPDQYTLLFKGAHLYGKHTPCIGGETTVDVTVPVHWSVKLIKDTPSYRALDKGELDYAAEVGNEPLSTPLMQALLNNELAEPKTNYRDQLIGLLSVCSEETCKHLLWFVDPTEDSE